MGQNLKKANNKMEAQFGTIIRKCKLFDFNKDKFRLLIKILIIVHNYLLIYPTNTF